MNGLIKRPLHKSRGMNCETPHIGVGSTPTPLLRPGVDRRKENVLIGFDEFEMRRILRDFKAGNDQQEETYIILE